MKSSTIKTQSYLIRPFKKEDCPLWQTWDIDPEIQAHMPEPKNEPVDINEQYEYINECESDEEGYYWSIDTHEGITIGTVSLFEINSHHGTAQIGIVIGNKDYWGKGVATEVIREIIHYAFNTLNLHYIGAEVEFDNTPMKKVFEKLGFEQDGLFKKARVKNSQRIDVAHFGISQ
jgi:[ribosomal protein S5]-alanine N-acetyltransferase